GRQACIPSDGPHSTAPRRAAPCRTWRRRWRCPARGSCARPASRRLPSGRSRQAATLLQDRQELVELPLRELRAVVLPLLALDLDEAREHVLTESLQDQLRLSRDLDRLAQ